MPYNNTSLQATRGAGELRGTTYIYIVPIYRRSEIYIILHLIKNLLLKQI